VRRFGEPPFTLGLDLSGSVKAVGESVKRFQPCDEVYAAVLPPRGAYAEYLAVPEDWLAMAPPSLDQVHAAALPTAALTAWQPLMHVADVHSGQRVLIHAAAGGVGHLAVQIAKARGAYVIGTARQDKHDFLHDLGADELIDYTTTDFTVAARNIDVVLDPISGDYGVRSLDTLTPGGILLDIRGTGPDRSAVREQAATRDLRYVEFGFAPSGTDLEDIAGLVERGALRVVVDRTLSMHDAAKAHELSETAVSRARSC
jgi:NADPH:quinone reductase-like Zn-dependent oxidoreductase